MSSKEDSWGHYPLRALRLGENRIYDVVVYGISGRICLDRALASNVPTSVVWVCVYFLLLLDISPGRYYYEGERRKKT